MATLSSNNNAMVMINESDWKKMFNFHPKLVGQQQRGMLAPLIEKIVATISSNKRKQDFLKSALSNKAYTYQH